jgi:twitching motility protein PilT
MESMLSALRTPLGQSGLYRQSDSGGRGGGGMSSDFSTQLVSYHIDDLLRLAKKNGASDLRLKAMSSPKFTINSQNVLCSEHGSPEAKGLLSPQQSQELVYALLSKNDIIKLENTGDVDLSYAVKMDEGHLQNFRVNAFKDRNGYGVVIRVLEPVAPRLEDLFSHDTDIIPIFESIFKRKEGLILVTGPTGSGKSTTIAAMIQHHLDARGGSLVTLEEPVEFYFQETNPRTSVIQREVGKDTESFETGLRAALREAPNILLVGEMRDKASVEGALQAAQTGHLVVATLHTNSAKDTLYRIINAVGSQNKDQIQTQLSQCLIGIVSQQLAGRAKPLAAGPLYAKNRIAIPELLLMNPAISNQIRMGKVEHIDNTLQTSREDGMRTRNQTIDLYLKKGLITAETAAAFRISSQG